MLDPVPCSQIFANVLFLNGKFWVFTRSIWTTGGRTRWHFHTRNQTREAWKRTTEPAALQAFHQNQIGQYDVTLSSLATEHLFQNGSCRCRILGFFGDQFLGIEYTLEAETWVSNLTQYKLFIGDYKKMCFLEWPSPITRKEWGKKGIK